MRRRWGCSITIVGVAFTLGDKAVESGGAAHQWVGELAVLASALCGAVCSVLYRPYLRKYPPVAVSALAMLSSVGFLALLAAAEGFFDAWPGFTTGGWLAILFIGASSGIGYYLWLWALNHTTATKVTVFLALSPITAALLGAVLLAERTVDDGLARARRRRARPVGCAPGRLFGGGPGGKRA